MQNQLLEVEIWDVYAHAITYYWYYEPSVISFCCIVAVCLVSEFQFLPLLAWVDFYGFWLRQWISYNCTGFRYFVRQI